MTLWKFYCMEDTYPGMWPRWFLHQCVGVGWWSGWGFTLTGDSDSRAWSRARNALKEIEVGDHIVVALRDHRVGRVGEVTGKAVEDTDWNPLVPRSTSVPDGEMGRRIFVRWDMTCGPESREWVIALPEHARFTPGEVRPTISKIQSISLDELQAVMNDPMNWVELWAHFDYERSLSGYIAAYPHRLEDGLLQHPSEKVRERVFGDQSRLDVILIDRNNVPVIVECKQGHPTLDHIAQLRHYMAKLQQETEQEARGVLVHGGARKLAPALALEAAKSPTVELVRYSVEIELSPCA
jgi:Endonuclease NucS